MTDLNKLFIITELFYKKAMQLGSIIKKSNNTDVNLAKSKKEDDIAEKWLRKNDPGTKFRVETPSEDVENTYTPSISYKDNSKDNSINLYPNIVSFIKQIKNEDIAEQLNKIAELYKEAIQNKKGYSLVSSAISRFLENSFVDNYSDYDNEDDVEPGENDITPEQFSKLEGQNIENFLNHVYANINNHFIKQRNIEKGFNQPEIESPESKEELEDTDGNGTGLGSVIDFAEIGGGRSRDDGKMSSMSVMNIRTPKDWTTSYQNDILRCIEQLKDPELNDKIRNGLKEQIEVLKKLMLNTSSEVDMLTDPGISWVTIPKTDTSPRRRVPSDQASLSKYESIKSEQKILRTTNNVIKTKVRSYSVLQKNSKIDSRLLETKSLKEEFLLKQLKLLNNLIASKDVSKADEINARRKFIKFIEGGTTPEQYENFPEKYLPNLNPELVKRYLKEIDDASIKKIPFEVYDEKRKKKYTEQRQNLYQYYGDKGTIRGKALSLTGSIKQFVESISSIKMGLKKNITAKLKADENSKYKPYKDAIASAVATGDVEGEKKAIKALMLILNAEAETYPQVIKFVEYSKPFKDCLDKVILLDADEKSDKLSSVKIPELINDIDHLLMLEKGRSSKSKLGEALIDIKVKLEASLPKTRISLNKPQELSSELEENDFSSDMEDRVEKLKSMMLTPPKQGHMNRKQRKIALAKLTKTALLDASIDGKVNAITSSLKHIKDPQAHADAAFDAILDSIVIAALE